MVLKIYFSKENFLVFIKLISRIDNHIVFEEVLGQPHPYWLVLLKSGKMLRF